MTFETPSENDRHQEAEGEGGQSGRADKSRWRGRQDGCAERRRIRKRGGKGRRGGGESREEGGDERKQGEQEQTVALAVVFIRELIEILLTHAGAPR